MKCKDCHYYEDGNCKVLDIIGYDIVINHKGDEDIERNDNFNKILLCMEKKLVGSDYSDLTLNCYIKNCDLNKHEDCEYFVDKNIYCKDCYYYTKSNSYSYEEYYCAILNKIGYDIELDHVGNKIEVQNGLYKKITRNHGLHNYKNLSEYDIATFTLNINKDCKWFKPKNIKIKEKKIVRNKKAKKKDKIGILKERIFKEFGEF